MTLRGRLSHAVGSRSAMVALISPSMVAGDVLGSVAPGLAVPFGVQWGPHITNVHKIPSKPCAQCRTANIPRPSSSQANLARTLPVRDILSLPRNPSAADSSVAGLSTFLLDTHLKNFVVVLRSKISYHRNMFRIIVCA